MTPTRDSMPARSVPVVVYEHAQLEDADFRLLGPATVDIAASTGRGNALTGNLRVLRPSAVLDEEFEAVVSRRSPPSVTCGSHGSITIAFWLADAVVVVKCKRLVMESVLDSWIERVRGDVGTELETVDDALSEDDGTSRTGKVAS